MPVTATTLLLFGQKVRQNLQETYKNRQENG